MQESISFLVMRLTFFGLIRCLIKKNIITNKGTIIFNQFVAPERIAPPIIRGSEFGSGTFCRNVPFVFPEFGGGGFSAINFSVSSTRSV